MQFPKTLEYISLKLSKYISCWIGRIHFCPNYAIVTKWSQRFLSLDAMNYSSQILDNTLWRGCVRGRGKYILDTNIGKTAQEAMIFINVFNVSELDDWKRYIYWIKLQVKWKGKHTNETPQSHCISNLTLRSFKIIQEVLLIQDFFNPWNDLNFNWITLESSRKVNSGFFINCLEFLSALRVQ